MNKAIREWAVIIVIVILFIIAVVLASDKVIEYRKTQRYEECRKVFPEYSEDKCRFFSKLK